MLRKVHNNKTAVSSSIGHCIGSVLGNTERLKCITEDGQAVYTKCPSEILRNLHIEHPIGDTFNDCLQSYHKHFRCGGKTLIVLLSLWLEEMQTLQHKGIPRSTILKGFRQAVDCCCASAEQLSIPIVDISQKETSDAAYTLKTETNCSPCQEARNAYSHSAEEKKRQVHNSTDKHSSDTEAIDIYNGGFHEIELKLPARSTHTYESHDSSSVNKEFLYNESMKQSQAEKQDNPDDDISWYFEGGKVPSPPTLDEETLSLMERISGLLDPTESDDIMANSMISKPDPLKLSTEEYSSLTAQSQDDNEFDSCFDDLIPSPEASDEENIACTSINQAEQSKRMGYTSRSATCESDDEFDSCFDDIPLNSNNSHKGNDKTIPETFENMSISMGDHTLINQHENIKVTGTTEVEDDVNVDELDEVALNPEERLQQILARKKVERKSRAENNSRHFKTIESTCAILQGESQSSVCENEIAEKHVPQSSMDHEQMMKEQPKDVSETFNSAEKLQHILARKELERNSRVENNSRHFKTIESTCAILQGNLSALDSAHGSTKNNIQHSTMHYEQKELGGSTQTETIERTTSNSLVQDTSSQLRTVESSESCRVYANDDVHEGSFTCTANPLVQELVQSSGDEFNDPSSYRDCSDSILPGSQKSHSTLTHYGERDWRDGFQSVCHKICRGSNYSAKFIEEIVCSQNIGASNLHNVSLDINRVHTLVMPSVPTHKSGLIEGLVMAASMDQVTLLTERKSSYNALLINGDVRHSFSHIGFKESVKATKIQNELTVQSPELSWLRSVCDRISKLQVTCILAKGCVDSNLKDWCESRGIVVLSNVSYQILLALATVTDTEIAVYIKECTQDDVSRGVTLQPWRHDCLASYHGDSSFIVASTADTAFHTAVFCHPCANIAQVEGEGFLHDLYRMRHVLQSRKVLPGGGVTEEQCIHHLLKQSAEKSSGSQAALTMYTPEVYKATARGLQSFMSLVRRNQGQKIWQDVNGTQVRNQWNNCDTSLGINTMDVDGVRCIEAHAILDDPVSKLEAWKAAAHMVEQTMLADYQVIAGCMEEKRGVIL